MVLALIAILSERRVRILWRILSLRAFSRIQGGLYVYLAVGIVSSIREYMCHGYGCPHYLFAFMETFTCFTIQKGLAAIYGIGLDWDCFSFMMDARMDG
jgi:hypothetical protein